MDTSSQILIGSSTAATAPVTDNTGTGGQQSVAGGAAQTPINQGSQPSAISFSDHLAQVANKTAVANLAGDSGQLIPVEINITFSQQPAPVHLVKNVMGNKLQYEGEFLPVEGKAPESPLALLGAESLSAEGVETAEDALLASHEGQQPALTAAEPLPLGSQPVSGELASTAMAGAQAPVTSSETTGNGLSQPANAFNKSGLNGPIQNQNLTQGADQALEEQKPISQQPVASTTANSGQPQVQTPPQGPELAAQPIAATVQPQTTRLQSGAGLNVEGATKLSETKLSTLKELTGSVNAQEPGDKSSTQNAHSVTAFPKVEGGASYQQVAATNLQTSIATQVTSPGWGETVMQRVMWMSSQHVRSAEIQLDPPELGSLMVKINTVNDQTSVNFTSAHATVRDALDQSLPRLKDMMNDQGLDLVDVDVSEHSGQGKASGSEADPEGEGSSQNGLLADAEQVDGESANADQTGSHDTLEPVGIINAYA